ncbi:hypothetical protein BDIM_26390 [Brevundimonas diminuta ATCC 11568]|nr:hypothetical protein BDIM_26390 [Brevundimonas diminuta ATCC 11568]
MRRIRNGVLRIVRGRGGQRRAPRRLLKADHSTPGAKGHPACDDSSPRRARRADGGG